MTNSPMPTAPPVGPPQHQRCLPAALKVHSATSLHFIYCSDGLDFLNGINFDLIANKRNVSTLHSHANELLKLQIPNARKSLPRISKSDLRKRFAQLDTAGEGRELVWSLRSSFKED